MIAVETIRQAQLLTPWRKATLTRALEIQRSGDLDPTKPEVLRFARVTAVAVLLATAPVTGPKVVGPVISQALNLYSKAAAFLNPSLNEPISVKPEAPVVIEAPVATKIPASTEPATQEPDPADNIRSSIESEPESPGTGGPILLEPARMVESAQTVEPAKPAVDVAQPPAVIIIPTAIPTPKALSVRRDLPAQPAYSPVLSESDWDTFYKTVQFYASVEGINPDFLWKLFVCENRDGKRNAGIETVELYGTRNGTVQIGMGQITPSISYFAATGMIIPEQRKTFSAEQLEAIYVRKAHYLTDPAYAARIAARLTRILNVFEQFPDCSRIALTEVGSVFQG